jgi:hypothetical protein
MTPILTSSNKKLDIIIIRLAQFKASYKRLIVKHEISGSKYGNCSILDAVTILHVSSSPKAKTNDTIILEEDLAECELQLNLEQGLFFSNDVLIVHLK